MIKKGDFVELDYVGKIKDDKIVFDTTVEQVAKDNKLHNPKNVYKPIIVCIGEGHLLKGLDEAMIGKEIGKFTVEIPAEKAFGKKSAELLKLIPAKLFSKDNVKPFTGLEVNVDGSYGIVRSVSGGRIIVDFNHPLSSKDLIYDVEIKRIVEDDLDKSKAVLELLSVPFEEIDIKEKKAEITTKIKFPEEAIKGIEENLIRLVGLKGVSFKTAEKKEVKKPVEKDESKNDSKTEIKE